MIKYIMVLVIPTCLILPVLFVLVPQAIKNHKQNKSLKDLPRWHSNNICPSCSFPIFPPLRYITDFPNPFCRLNLMKAVISCSKCQHTQEIAVEVE